MLTGCWQDRSCQQPVNSWYMSCVYVDWLLAGSILPTASQHKRINLCNFDFWFIRRAVLDRSIYVLMYSKIYCNVGFPQSTATFAKLAITNMNTYFHNFKP